MRKLVELVNLWAAYEESHPGAEIEDFCLDYLSRMHPEPEPAAHHDFSDWPLQRRLGKAIYRLSKINGFYTRKAMQGLPLSNLEDFVYLASLYDGRNPRKSELIHQHISEFTSGVSVLRRLADMGFVEEQHDPEDARSKRVRITDAGRQALDACMQNMNQVSDLLFSQLREDEIRPIVEALEQVEQHHVRRYPHLRQQPFGRIAGASGG
ncbi:MAG: winged helix DNA-binding protein [Bacteroidia bacterium]|nr:winged helix DNA-binding protein [Bacteroidia bacterium]